MIREKNKMIGKTYLLGPTAHRLRNGKLDGKQLQGLGRINPAQAREWLGTGKIHITMPSRLDFFGSVDLPGCKAAIADKGVLYEGNPVTCTFATDYRWRFSLEANEDPEVNTFISLPYGFTKTTKGKLPFGTFEDKTAVNWVLGYFGLKGVKMTAHHTPPVLKSRERASSNMSTAAATIFGSIVSGADYPYGNIFTLSTRHDNTVHGGITGGQGFAAAIMGGACGFEWNDSYEQFSALAHPLFGPERYPEFQDHVFMYLPGMPKGTPISPFNINGKWTKDMTLTTQGNADHRQFVELSNIVFNGLRSSGGINWLDVCMGLQYQTDIRQKSCPLYLQGIKKDVNKLVVRGNMGSVQRAVIRLGAGGLGTPVIVVSSTKELADEAKQIAGETIIFTEEMVKNMKLTGKIPRGRIPLKLTPDGIKIEFVGLVDGHKFNVPGAPEEVEFPK
jgi:hypothetical protein